MQEAIWRGARRHDPWTEVDIISLLVIYAIIANDGGSMPSRRNVRYLFTADLYSSVSVPRGHQDLVPLSDPWAV